MTKLYVGNLPFSATEDSVRELFAAHGTVEKVALINDRDTGQPRGFGFVEMSNNEEAQKAISGMNGSQLGSRAINVNEARPKEARAGAGGRGGFGGRGGGGGRGRSAGGGGFRGRY